MIVLPWPDKRLSSNARVHHMELHKVKRSHRVAAGWAAKAYQPALPASGDIVVQVTFEPPSRRFDRFNMEHLIKSYIDGVADAWGVNDRRFLPRYVYGEPVRGGRVTIELADKKAAADAKPTAASLDVHHRGEDASNG